MSQPSFKQEEAYFSDDLDDSSDGDSIEPWMLRDAYALKDPQRKSRAYRLGLTRGYVRGWTKSDAFRELYQNFKDAIVKVNSLNPRDFSPLVEETGNEIRITVRAPIKSESTDIPRKLLGYILFKKTKGTVELTNFNAALRRENLAMGGTTKVGSSNMAGTHGEGLKLAALIFARKSHGLKLTSRSQYGNFKMDKSGQLRCRITDVSESAIKKRKEKFTISRPNRDLQCNMWEDVSVELGNIKQNEKVTEDEFRTWLEVTLDINGPPPDEIIRTSQGDLLLGPKYSGKIYLKSLFIGAPTHGGAFKFGYNFINGEVNRDREQISGAEDQAMRLASIWRDAISQKGDDILVNYYTLLQHDPKRPDINLIEKNVRRSTAKKIFEWLKGNHPQSFFFAESDGDQAHDTIARYLKLQPQKLSKLLWQVLRKHDLVRTPDEQRIHLFTESEPTTLPNNTFSLHIERALQASLLLNPITANTVIQFVNGGDTGLDLLYVPGSNLLKINDKWTDFQRAHQITPCQLSRSSFVEDENSGIFLCDHIVQELVDLAANDIFKASPIELSLKSTAERALRNQVREKLEQMPRKITVSPTDIACQLEVTWVDSRNELYATLCGSSVRYSVTLHKAEICDSEMTKTLYQGNEPSPSCGCPRQVCAEKKAIFADLDPFQRYFAIVAQLGEQTFLSFSISSANPNAVGTAAESPLPDHGGIMTDETEHMDLDNGIVDDQSSLSHLGTTESDVNMIISDDKDDIAESRTDIKKESPSQAHPQSSAPTGRISSSRIPSSTQPSLRSDPSHTHNPDIRNQQSNESFWRNWYERDLLNTFSLFRAQREMETQDRSKHVHVEAIHLVGVNHTFRTGRYAKVSIGGIENSSEHIIFIHDIYRETTQQGGGIGLASDYRLRVTKLSYLTASRCFNGACFLADHFGDFIGNELLLDFEEFDSMGTKQDAEILKLHDCTKATDIETDVVYISGDPTDLKVGQLFCRFGLHRGSSPKFACLTPVNSHLLSPQQAWKFPKYDNIPRPIVYDFTPGILGASEGFVGAGYTVNAAVGFDEGRHFTWRARHGKAKVFDGPPENALGGGEELWLKSPFVKRSQTPRVFMIAGANDHFDTTGAIGDSGLREFISPLSIVDDILRSPDFHRGFDFVNLTMPSGILQPMVRGLLLDEICKLLKLRYAVHLKLVHFYEHNLPQERSILILVASPICGALPWEKHWKTDHESPPGTNVYPCMTVKEKIGDLTFANQVTARDPDLGFVCNYEPPRDTQRRQGSQGKYVYNHQTGQQSGAKDRAFSFEDDGRVSFSPRGVPSMIHPVRKDLLTVREIARLQGFTDDFIFYGSRARQYEDVSRALPPPIAEKMANVITDVIHDSQKTSSGRPAAERRASKRQRTSPSLS